MQYIGLILAEFNLWHQFAGKIYKMPMKTPKLRKLEKGGYIILSLSYIIS